MKLPKHYKVVGLLSIIFILIGTIVRSPTKLNLSRSFHSQRAALTNNKIQSSLKEQTNFSLQENALTLKQTILSTREKGQSRETALFQLTQMGLDAADSLAEIAQSEIPNYAHLENPHSADSYQKNFEISLRVTALEALDTLAVDHPSIENKIIGIFEKQKDPHLKLLTQISLSGIQNHNPGKIKRVIDTILMERGKQ